MKKVKVMKPKKFLKKAELKLKMAEGNILKKMSKIGGLSAMNEVMNAVMKGGV